jgi:hypothetical protein
VTWSLETWTQEVQDAAEGFDEARLRILFDIGRRELGDRLDHEWSEALSGFDATAITG